MAVKIRLKTVEILLLIMVWVVLVASPLLFREGDFFNWKDMLGPLDLILPLFIIFILNRFVLVPCLLFRSKNIYYLLSVFIIIALFNVGSYYFPYDNFFGAIPQQEFRAPKRELHPDMMPPDHGFPPPMEPERSRPLPPFVNLLVFSILLVGFDTGLKIFFKLAQTEKEKAKLETENVSTQLAFLRNQVSPHFFMNTLNNIHAQIDINTEEAKDSLIRLSKLMRHLIYDSEAEKLPISKELDFISNYIDLMSLRYSEKVKIKLDLPENLPDKTIPPLLFTSFVENAFKHGISYENSSFVYITFKYEEDNLIMEIKNSNHNIISEKEASGIGIQNSRKRLDLLYDDNYSLDIKTGNKVYLVVLKIPL